WRQDITITFDAPQRTEAIADVVRRVPGVASLDNQMVVLGARRRPDGSDAEEDSAIFGVEPDSAAIHPTVVQGRWLTARDTNARGPTVDCPKHEPDVRIGDTVTLTIDGRKTNWLIVGVSTSQMIGLGAPQPGQPMVYANYPSLAAAMLTSGFANRAAITLTR